MLACQSIILLYVRTVVLETGDIICKSSSIQYFTYFLMKFTEELWRSNSDFNWHVKQQVVNNLLSLANIAKSSRIWLSGVPEGLVSKLHSVRAAVLFIVVTAFIVRGSRCSGPGRLWGRAANVVGRDVLLLLKPPFAGCCWMDMAVRPVNEHDCQHHNSQK